MALFGGAVAPSGGVTVRKPGRPKGMRKARHAPCHLRAWREARGLSQHALAMALRRPVAATTIGRLEDGLIPWRQELVEDLAEALHITPFELLFVDPDDPAAMVVEWMRTSPYGREALAAAFSYAVEGLDERLREARAGKTSRHSVHERHD